MKNTRILQLSACMTLAMALFCSLPQAPAGPENAGIDETESFRVFDTARDTVEQGTQYVCSVKVVHRIHLDSFTVVLKQGPTESVLACGVVAGEHISFSWTPSEPGTYELMAIVYRNNNTADSLVRRITVRSGNPPGPQIRPDSLRYHYYFSDTATATMTVRFTVRDSASSLWLARIRVNDGTPKDTIFAPRTTTATLERVISATELLAGLEQGIACRIEVINADSLVAAAVCSVVVKDTVKPTVQRVFPTSDTIEQVPVWVVLQVTDNWGVDSAHFNGVRMDLLDDTAKIRVWTLDKGRTNHSITVWDKAANERTTPVVFFFEGNPVYPPRIRDLDTAISEGSTFSPVFLDSAVTITDPSPAYTVDSLRWIITDLDTTPNKVIAYVLPGTHDSLRWFRVPVPADPHWFGVRRFRFEVLAPGGLSDQRVATFYVTPVNDPPKIRLTDRYICGTNSRFDTLFLDTMATDPDDAAPTLLWSWQDSSTHLRVRMVYSTFMLLKSSSSEIGPMQPIRGFFTRRLVVAPKDSTWYGIDSLRFEVKDPHNPPGVDRKTVKFSRRQQCIIFNPPPLGI